MTAKMKKALIALICRFDYEVRRDHSKNSNGIDYRSAVLGSISIRTVRALADGGMITLNGRLVKPTEGGRLVVGM